MAQEPKDRKNSVDCSPVQSTLFNESADMLPASNKKPRKKAKETKIQPLVYDYKTGDIPERIQDLINAHLAIEKNDAKKAGSLGFMARSLAIATLPHRRQSDYRFQRKNGNFTLTMTASHPNGLPFGTLPRLLLNWVCTEAVRTQEREINIGASVKDYMIELGLTDGGRDYARFREALETLFTTMITCMHSGAEQFKITNMIFADRVDWWEPQTLDETIKPESRIILSDNFFKECVEHPVPVDKRAIKALRQSPLALDIYIWLTLRMSYLSQKTTIPWLSVANQFGSDYALNTPQGVRDFKRAFIRELKKVVAIYPAAQVAEGEHGLVLYPSRTHVPKLLTPKIY